MDLNQLYFDHQILLMKAQHAQPSGRRERFEASASGLACRISRIQRTLGAAAAGQWKALAAVGGCDGSAAQAHAL